MWTASDTANRTTYLIGLFGSGRRYVTELLTRNLGERAKYFRDGVRLHSGPSPMIYSGHVTIKYLSRGQEVPSTMRQIRESVNSGFADVIFVYRHPLDSLLTNWIWWRTYLRENRMISGISEQYANIQDFCAELSENFSEFAKFAAGDPDFFAPAGGPRFLSFSEFVEETELHLQSATLALRLEDFMIDPLKELSKILRLMSVDIERARLSAFPPKSRSYTHLAVAKAVPQFRDFIGSLNGATESRFAAIGYE